MDTDKFVDPVHKKIRSKLCARGYKTQRQGETQRSLFVAQLSSAMSPLEAVKVLVMMSVGWSTEGKPLKLRHNDINRAHFQGTAQRHSHVRLPAEDRHKVGR